MAVLLPASAGAQITTGEIFGKVTDATGLVLPGVTITLTSPSLQQPLTAVSTSTGAYSFPQLPIGTYTVTFDLGGFKKLVREGIVVNTGFNAEINGKLDVSTIQETVTVSGESPIVDTKSTTTGATFDRMALENLPTARDPWQVLNMVPGMVLSGVNVGGSASGQQLTVSSMRGQGNGNTQWNVEGATTTDMAATGASATYYDFDSFEEIQFTTGGADASIQTSGVNINMITKSGSNMFKGSVRGTYAGDSLQSNNVSRDIFYGGGTTTTPLAGNPMKQVYEYGGEAGGPIIRNKLWWWGAYAKSDINVGVAGFFKQTPECTPVPNEYENISDTFNCMHPDKTTLDNYNAKINYQLNQANKFQFLYTFGDKKRNAREASPTRPPETAKRQYGGVPMYNAKHTWILTDRLLFETMFQYTGGGFTLDLQNPEVQYDLQPRFDDDTNMWSRSHDQYITNRPATEAKTDGSYFVSNMLGGDHQLKFGFRYRNTPIDTFQHMGGDAIAQFDNGGIPEFAYLYRDHNISIGLNTMSSYIQDSFSRGRLRLNMGLRWDRQDDEAKPTSVGANPIIPDYLPGLDFQGADSGIVFSDWSPRLSATYDLFGTGKTVLKGTFAYYFTQGGLFSGNSNPASEVVLRAAWNDANRDTFVQRSELDLSTLIVDDGNFDLATRSVPGDPNTVDSGIKNDRTREIIAGVSHELMPNFGLDVNYIYRIYDQFNGTRRIGETADMWVQREWILTPQEIANLPAGLPTTGWFYWEVAPGVTRPINVTNRFNVEENNRYHGLEIAARKRYSNRWMMNASFAWNDRRDYDLFGAQGGFDLTNLALEEGYNAQIKYVAKLAGMFTLPGAWNVSGNMNIQQGSTRTIVYRAPNRISGQRFGGFDATTGARLNLGTFDFRVEPAGSTHLPTLSILDLQIDKAFRIGRNRFNFTATLFNSFNVATVRSYSSNRLDQSTFTRVSGIVPPRVGRFMLRWSF
jgi:hypothetical protein